MILQSRVNPLYLEVRAGRAVVAYKLIEHYFKSVDPDDVDQYRMEYALASALGRDDVEVFEVWYDRWKGVFDVILRIRRG